MRQRRAGPRSLVLEHQAVAKSAVVAPMSQPLGIRSQHVAQFATLRARTCDRRAAAISMITSCTPNAGSHRRGRFSRPGELARRKRHRRKYVRHDADPPAAFIVQLVRRRLAACGARCPGRRGSSSVLGELLASTRRRDGAARRRIRSAAAARSSATRTVRPVSQSVRSSGTDASGSTSQDLPAWTFEHDLSSTCTTPRASLGQRVLVEPVVLAGAVVPRPVLPHAGADQLLPHGRLANVWHARSSASASAAVV